MSAHDHDHEDMMEMHDSKYQETYLKLAGSRNIFFCEDVTSQTASTMTALLIYYDSISHDDINIYINSNGGDADALINIYDVMQLISSPVKTICVGKAYSAASIILAAGTKGKRYLYKNSEVMLHQLQCSFPIYGKEGALSSAQYYEFLNDYNDSVIKILSKHVGKSMATIKKDLARDLFLSPKDAVKYGIADHIM